MYSPKASFYNICRSYPCTIIMLLFLLEAILYYIVLQYLPKMLEVIKYLLDWEYHLSITTRYVLFTFQRSCHSCNCDLSLWITYNWHIFIIGQVITLFIIIITISIIFDIIIIIICVLIIIIPQLITMLV